MAIYLRNEENIEALFAVAEKMAIAARTAPKTRGKDVVQLAIVEGDEKEKLSADMEKIAEEYGMAFFERDADNLRQSLVVLLIGAKVKVNGLKPCGMCGFPDCKSKQAQPEVPCAFNSIDLGIAIGSAISVAADHRVDNRVMYTIGQAALRLKLFDDNVKTICAIPLSAKGKNPFFDRIKKA